MRLALLIATATAVGFLVRTPGLLELRQGLLSELQGRIHADQALAPSVDVLLSLERAVKVHGTRSATPPIIPGIVHEWIELSLHVVGCGFAANRTATHRC